MVELDAKEKVMPFGIISNVGMEEIEMNLKEMLGGLLPEKTKKRKLKVPEALRLLVQEEAAKLIDMDKVIREALQRVEQSGIVFLDEIDKIAGRETRRGPMFPARACSATSCRSSKDRRSRPSTARSGPTTFCSSPPARSISSKPSDLIPELQGRFPIRVELDSLGKEEFVRILTEPQNALIKQQVALLADGGDHPRIFQRTPSRRSRQQRRP